MHRNSCKVAIVAQALIGMAMMMTLMSTARAELTQVSPGGFVSSHREALSVPAEAAWKAVLQLPRWWSSRHTYSGQAANLSLDAQAGGCWCERWGEGAAASSVQHGVVLAVLPSRALRIGGAFGPLQELGASGVLDIDIASVDGKPTLRMRYRITGSPDVGLDKLAPAVDGVIGEQFRRLKKLAETGNAE